MPPSQPTTQHLIGSTTRALRRRRVRLLLPLAACFELTQQPMAPTRPADPGLGVADCRPRPPPLALRRRTDRPLVPGHDPLADRLRRRPAGGGEGGPGTHSGPPPPRPPRRLARLAVGGDA